MTETKTWTEPHLLLDAQRLLFDVEVGVRGFSRYHKYTVSAELRREAVNLCRAVKRSFSVPAAHRRRYVQGAMQSLEELKITPQLYRLPPPPTRVQLVRRALAAVVFAPEDRLSC